MAFKGTSCMDLRDVGLVLMLCVLNIPSCNGGNILVTSLDGSHWVNMKVMLEELYSRGHTLTLIRSNSSWYIPQQSHLYTTIDIPSNIKLEFFGAFLEKQLQAQMEGLASLVFLAKDFINLFNTLQEMWQQDLINIFTNTTLLEELKEAKYDLMLTDSGLATGVVIAKYLNLPLVLNSRWFYALDGHFLLAPSPLSYIPVTSSGFTDKMSFLQRAANVLYFIFALAHQYLAAPGFDAICQKYVEEGCTIASLLQDADIWLLRSDFVFDFPRPTMPNVVYMGGFQCKPPQPLPQELEDFVQSAGEHGVIIMTLGCFVNALPITTAEEIASVFAKLPQKVIWRHKGERPSTLGNNTLIVDWIPQKDLLGHPQTRVFVGHGGTNGVQEAIYHGVPMLGIPLFFDQYDNLLRVQARGAAQIIKLKELNSERFENGLRDLLEHEHYRNNMQKLSHLHKDQPLSPMNRAMYWVEFVMRHKGASHLRTQACKMPWFSYYCVDVLLLLLTVIIVTLLSVVALLRLLCCRNKTKFRM